MKKSLLLLLIGGLLSFGAAAQSQTELFGTWRFSDIKQTQGMNKEGYEAAKQVLSSAFITFSGDLAYDSDFAGSREAGKWTFDDTKHKIFLTAKDGTKSEAVVEKMDNGTMHLNIDGTTIIFKRDGGNE